jgi:hypothetical protein
MNQEELDRLINRISDRFEQATGLSVFIEARRALLTPAIPYLDRVTRELGAGTITVAFLEDSLETVLKNGMADARRRGVGYIDAEAITRSIAQYCPYLFWC